MKFGDQVHIDDLVRDTELDRLSAEEFDALPFGAIKLDASNRVTAYNAAEADLARRDRDETIGKRFFEEIAPCTDNERFRGRLEELARSGATSARFDYKFLFPWGAREVRIQFWVPGPDERWIFVTPSNDAG